MDKIFKELSDEELDNLSIQEMKAILQQAVLIKKDEDDILWNVTSNAISILSFAGKSSSSSKIPSALPEHSDNKFLNYAYAVGRGIEHGRDEVVDAILHPIDTAKHLATASFDGYNAIAGLLFNYSTEGSRARNIVRGDAVLDCMDKFRDGDGVTRTKMISKEISSLILGGAVAGLAGEVSRFVYKSAKTNYYTRNFSKALPNPTVEGHIFPKRKYNGEIKPGHLANTLENKKEIIKTRMDQRNFLFEDKHGVQTFARPLENGITESWVEVQKGKIKSGGINGGPRNKKLIKYFTNKDGTLSAKYADLARNKQIQATIETTLETSTGITTIIADKTTAHQRKRP